MRAIEVVLVTVTEDKDEFGDMTSTETSESYDGVRFAPRSSAERSDPRAPAVVTGASLYRRGDFPAQAADRIEIVDQHPTIDGVWQVDGDAGYWGSGVEVAIKRVGGA